MKIDRHFDILRKYIEPILKSTDKNRGNFIVKFFLLILSYIYKIAVKVRYCLFRKRILAQKRIPCKTVSVGNLTVGGTGKTPFVIYLAKLMRRFGLNVVIASRGYGGKMEKDECVVSNGVSCTKNVFEVGDEPYLITKLLKGVPVVVGKNKFKVGMKAVRIFDPDVIIYDDAFQHLGMKYDLNLVLMNSEFPLGNGFMLPRGILREPTFALKRADAIIFTRNSGKKPYLNYSCYCPKFTCSHKLVLRKIVKKRTSDHEYDLKGKSIIAFSGIANNSELHKELTKLGLILKGKISFKDHHNYNSEDIKNILNLLKQTNADFLATTDKDYVKLENIFYSHVTLLVFGVDINFAHPESEVRFANFMFNFIYT